jgi:MoxR-like ATPase
MSDQLTVQKVGEFNDKIQGELSKVIVGQEEIIEGLLIALMAHGHAVLVGVPGLAKTRLVHSLAQIIHLDFNRIQFTPDLMPSDITGTDILQDDKESGHRKFVFLKGPIFSNILLADEINRTPPKTQAALLQAMQEYSVTAGGRTYALPPPFFVLATQNPIEQEGTYPLPEAQLDRFMLGLWMEYPSFEEEVSIVRMTTDAREESLSPVLTGEQVVEIQEMVRTVPVSDEVVRYAVRLVTASRPGEEGVPDFVPRWLSWGAGPRAGQNLILAGKARALLRGRPTVSPEDIRAMALPVLRHRLVPSFHAEAENISSKDIVEKLLEVVPTP